jgi:hypothetical protein
MSVAGGKEMDRGAIDRTPPHPDAPPAFEVRVLVPGGPCNVLEWDAQSGALRLGRVVRPAAPRGADLARLPLLSPFAERPDATPPPRRAAIFARTAAGEDTPAPGVADPDGPPPDLLVGPGLLVVLLADPPVPPGTWARARPLGAWRPYPAPGEPALPAPTMPDDATLEALGAWTIIAVPEADAAFDAAASIADLPEAWRVRLDGALRSLDASAGHPAAPSAVWLDARAATDLCNRARLAARRTRGGDDAVGMTLAEGREGHAGEAGGRAAWRALSGLSAAELRALGPGAYSEAEHLLRFIPHRFSRYLGELLARDERVLFFAERPAATPHAAGRVRDLIAGRRPARLQAGLLLVTDQQVLCVRDFAPPDATLVEWGYLARSYPLGRLVGACALPPHAAFTSLAERETAQALGLPVDDAARATAALRALGADSRRELAADALARLVVAVEGRAGLELAAMAVPSEVAGGLDWAAQLLRGFAPRRGAMGTADRRLRPLPAVGAWDPPPEEVKRLEGLGGEIAPPLRDALDAALAGALAPEEKPLAVARAADPDAGGGGQEAAHLLALTASRLIVARARRAPRSRPGATPVTVVTSRDLGELTSASLQHSLLGCALWASRPARGAADGKADAPDFAVSFASPAIEPFRALFVRLRALLGGPITAP